MSQIRILVCRVDDEAPDQLTEPAAIELPEPTPASLATATALEALEATTLEKRGVVITPHLATRH